VNFCHPAEFIRYSEEDGILASSGAAWFIAILKRIDGLDVQSELCQEDWGVVIFVGRRGYRFWIGLSGGATGGETAWLAHMHHGSFSWLQRLLPGGRREFWLLVLDIHRVLSSDPSVTDIKWFTQKQLMRADLKSAASPDGA
jgi:hypothetical protein